MRGQLNDYSTKRLNGKSRRIENDLCKLVKTLLALKKEEDAINKLLRARGITPEPFDRLDGLLELSEAEISGERGLIRWEDLRSASTEQSEGSLEGASEHAEEVNTDSWDEGASFPGEHETARPRRVITKIRVEDVWC